jgi:hypothetical protein
MAGMLLRLLSDLMHDDKLRRRFNAEPYTLMSEYGLSADARAALYTMDRDQIGDFVKDEIKVWPFPPGWDVTEEDPDCQGSGLYPDPKPTIIKVKPDNKAQGKFELTIKGEGFTRDATVVLIHRATKATVIGTTPKVTGTYRCCHLTAQFDFSTAAKGAYDIEVDNSPTFAQYTETLTRSASFTLT